MVEDDRLAEGSLRSGEHHLAIGGGQHGSPPLARHVDARVELALAREGRDAGAEARGEPALRRPDGRRRGQPLVLVLELRHQLLERELALAGHVPEPLHLLAKQAQLLVLARGGARLARGLARGRKASRGHGLHRVATLAVEVAIARGPHLDDTGSAGRRRARQVRNGADLALELAHPAQRRFDLGDGVVEGIDPRLLLRRDLAKPVELRVLQAHHYPVHQSRHQQQRRDAGRPHGAAHGRPTQIHPPDRRGLVGYHDQRKAFALHQDPFSTRPSALVWGSAA